MKLALHAIRYLALGFLIALTAACGGGSSGGSNQASTEDAVDSGNSDGDGDGTGGDDQTGDFTAPSAKILFPHIDGLITGPFMIKVRGTAHDESGVSAIRVNGINAALTEKEGFWSWEATLPPTCGSAQLIRVETEDIYGNVTPEAAVRTVSTRCGLARAPCRPVDFDPNTNSIFHNEDGRVAITDVASAEHHTILKSIFYMNVVHDSSTGDVFAVDEKGNVVVVDMNGDSDRMISPEGTDNIEFDGLDTWFGNSLQIAFDESSGELYVYGYDSSTEEGHLYSVDIESGARIVVSGASVGAGLAFDRDSKIAAAAGRIFTLLYPAAALLEIDPATGDRKVVSDPSTGLGPYLGSPQAFAIDSTATRAFVGNFYDEVIEVDLSTGNRAVLSPRLEYLDEHLSFEQNYAMAIDSNSGTIYLGCATDQLISISTESGARGRVTVDQRGSGVPLGDPMALAYDSRSDRILVLTHITQEYVNELMAVDPITGDRQVLSSELKGGGEIPAGNVHLAVDSITGRVFATEFPSRSIIEIDPVSGERGFLSGGEYGSGPAFDFPAAMSVDGKAGVIYLVDPGLDAVFSVNMENGERFIVSQPGVAGSGASWENTAGIALDLAGQRAFVSDNTSNAIYLVDLGTGERTEFSSDNVAEGPSLSGPAWLAKDPTRGKIVVQSIGSLEQVGATFPMVFVDLETGAREIRNAPGASTEDPPAVDPKTGLIYQIDGLRRPDAPGNIEVYDYESSQTMTLSQ
ncbi:hypothetical protein [Microbulbifer yueqingensis]|uniref:DNA-binding beta-propeller fold protein YncE n=1 Tax=Microbulbifer yueqingensis TaxID=658219 RepID=A0A1G9DLD8_9GAMM|nr:hypothetical protein [Microbulbifer yueqingensis]SDK64689.1 hypothetical protein SAMN05216212_2857 [Microbulbifer yueqingensis]